MKIIEYVHHEFDNILNISREILTLETNEEVDAYFNDLNKAKKLSQLDYSCSKFYIEDNVNCVLVDVYL